jgi:hypothetical protein
MYSKIYIHDWTRKEDVFSFIEKTCQLCFILNESKRYGFHKKKKNMKARGSAGLQTEKDKEPTQESLPPSLKQPTPRKKTYSFRNLARLTVMGILVCSSLFSFVLLFVSNSSCKQPPMHFISPSQTQPK